MTLVVNLLGGPGTGKSTTAAGTFAELKQAGVNAELVTEYAKDLVWGHSTHTLGNQIYIFGKQYHRLWRLVGQVDVIVTDCPLFLSMYYGEHMSPAFKALVLETFNSFDNHNVFLARLKAYNPKGRVQSEEKARSIDDELHQLLIDNEIPFDYEDANRTAAGKIAKEVIKTLDSK